MLTANRRQVESLSKQASKQGRFYVQPISHSLADDFLIRHHYLAQQGHGFVGFANYGLFTNNDKFIGAVTYSGISVVGTLIGAFEGFDRKSNQDGFYELSRLAMDDESKEKNLTSWFVSKTIRMLRHERYVRAIISYADSKYHHGYIYQATNFKYYGLSAPKTDFFYIDTDGNERQLWRGSTKDYEGEWKQRSRKHRYMMVFDKSLHVLWKEQPYPKGDNDEYELSVPQQYQTNIFDFL